MAEPDDPLSREVVIAAKLEENGIAIRTRSRAVAALDRLAGSLFDMPTAFFEGVARKKRLQDEIHERLRNAQAELAEKQLKGISGAGDALVRDILEDRARKQINAAGVAVETIDALKALPSPIQDEGATVSPNDGEQLNQIDEDWMNQFIRYAEDASSEDLQQIWGRVLAGESKKDGSFSRHTLRFIAELDRETAANCEFAARRLIGNFIPKNDEWNRGEVLMIGLDLQRLGLVEGVGGLGPQKRFEVEPGGEVGIFGRDWALLVQGVPGTTITIDAMLLTRMGREVFSLLEVSNEPEAFRKMSETMNKSGLKKITLGTFKHEESGNARFFANDVLWEVSAT